MKQHKIKLNIPFFDEVETGNKRFEIRLNDRDYEEGDVVIMKEFDSDNDRFTGRSIKKTIGFLTDYAQQEGYVVFSIF